MTLIGIIGICLVLVLWVLLYFYFVRRIDRLADNRQAYRKEEEMADTEYRNIYTRGLVKIRRSEVVRGNPSDFAIYVLSDGTRWQQALFHQHFEEVTRTKAKKS